MTATPSALLVTAADKTHNARSLVSDIRLYGIDYLKPFTATPEQTVWYYREMSAALMSAGAPVRSINALAECVRDLEELISGGMIR